MIRRLYRYVAIWLIGLATVGCVSASQLASTIATADTVGRGVANVLGWCEAHDANPQDVQKAVEAAKAGDYAEALRLARLMVDAAKASGATVPAETASILDLAQEVIAARAVEQAARALAGRNSDGGLRY